jgi:hypothetical protein
MDVSKNKSSKEQTYPTEISEESHIDFEIASVRRVRRRTSAILPDGSKLSDLVNSDLMDSIKTIIMLEKAKNNNDASLPNIFTSLYLLIQWMFLRGVYRFEHLSESLINEFRLASSKGLDVLINATPRVIETLRRISKGELYLESKDKVSQIYTLSGINDKYGPRLKRVNTLIENFLNSGELNLNNEISVPLEKTLSKGTLNQRFKNIRLLWIYKDELKSQIKFDPFPNGAWLASQSIGKEQGTTKTIPIELIPNLVAGAILWVEKFAPTFISLNNQTEKCRAKKTKELIDQFNAENINSLNWILVKKNKDKETQVSVRKAKTFTYVACLVILHIFTARRASEISGLKSKDLIGSFNNRFLLTDIGKTQLKSEPTPCPEIVAIAFNTVLKMRGLSFDYNGRLWKSEDSGQHYYEKNLDNFARVIGAIQYFVDGVMHEWHYAIHQFRRIFAVLYVWRFEGPFSAIQHHLRHVNWKQTFTYVRDKNLYNEVLSTSVALTTEKLLSLASGDIQKPAGVQSLVLKKHLDRLRKKVDITDENSLERLIKSYIEDRNLILRPTLWGYCGSKSNTSNIRRASCQKESNHAKAKDPIFNAPDGSGSTEEICAGCFFHFSDESREAHWRGEVVKIIKMQKLIDPKSESGKSLQKRKDKIQSFINKYYE